MPGAIQNMLRGGAPQAAPPAVPADPLVAYAKGKIDEYTRQQQVAQARAQMKGQQTTARVMKQAQTPPPQLAQPGTGVTAPSPIQGLWQQIAAQLGKH